MPSLLKVAGLCKSFLLDGRSVQVLRDINLEVREGELCTIIGPSGCGKSTLLELFAGITVPDCGRILLRGQEISGQAGHAGYMPQDDLLLPWLTLLENAVLAQRIGRKNIAAARSKALALLPDFGLEGYAEHLPWQLSGGMKQRAAFLRTVMSEAEILLLDEPFANLDALTRLQMQQWLASLRSKLGRTIVFVTHDIDEAIRLSDTIHVMDKAPGPFLHMVEVPRQLNGPKTDMSEQAWVALKADLIDKLI